MNMISGLRDRLPGRGTSSNGESGATAEDGSPLASPADNPIENYNRLDSRQVMNCLFGYSQADLATVEEYERAHKNRPEVLTKLRYMRCAEPFEGYDKLEAAEVVVKLESADLATVKRIRTYESKFAGRRVVVEAVATVFRDRRAATPRRDAPAQEATQ